MICVGGPLDGRATKLSDFEKKLIARHDGDFSWFRKPTLGQLGGFLAGETVREGGVFADHAGDYILFNRGDRSSKVPKSIMLWKGLLP